MAVIEGHRCGRVAEQARRRAAGERHGGYGHEALARAEVDVTAASGQPVGGPARGIVADAGDADVVTERQDGGGPLVVEPRRWLVYYGGADTHVGVAAVTVLDR